MKLKTQQKNLMTALGRAQNIVEKRNTMPVLINVLLDAENANLKMFATDLEVSLTCAIDAEVENEGRVAVNAKSLFEILKELPEGEVTLEKKENNWLTIKKGKAIFNMVGVSPDEYPVFPTFSTKEFMKVKAEVLAEMIEKTIYSVSTDEKRYHLNGVLFEKQAQGDSVHFRMVATDGHRLSLVDRQSTDVESFGDPQGVIIPRKGLNEIRKLIDFADGDIEMAVEGAQLVVRKDSTVLMIRLIEGKYPNYQQLIPQNLKERLVVPREALLSSLKRVSLLSNQKSKGVTLALSSGRMEITSNNPELGDAKEELSVDYGGKEMRIGFNAKYILDVLGSMNDDMVQIELNDQLSPGLVRPQNDKSYTCVVMPMRI